MTKKCNITTEFEVITPKLAAKYLEKNLRNRPINHHYVSKLSRQIKEGKWQIDGNAIRFDTDDRMIDGQHRLSAIVLSQVAVQSLVLRNLPSESQTTIDTGNTRRGGHIWAMRAEGGSPLSNSMVGACESAVKVILCMEEHINAGPGKQLKLNAGRMLAPNEVYELLLKYKNIEDCVLWAQRNKDKGAPSILAAFCWVVKKYCGEDGLTFLKYLEHPDGNELFYEIRMFLQKKRSKSSCLEARIECVFVLFHAYWLYSIKQPRKPLSRSSVKYPEEIIGGLTKC